MAVVGATFHQGMHSVRLAERMSQADTLTDRLLAEIDLGLAPILQPVEAPATGGDAPGGSPGAAAANQSQELTGYFGEDAPPGLSWKVETSTDVELPDMVKVAVHIYEGDPDGGENEQVRLMSTFVLRAQPRNINLETDFGFSEEQLTLLTDAIPGGAAILDPTNFDPRSIAQLDLETLRTILPALIAAMGGGALGGGDLDALIQAAQRGDVSTLQKLGQQLGAQGGGQPPPGGAPSPGAAPQTPSGGSAAPSGRPGADRGGQGTGQSPQRGAGRRGGS